MPNSHLPPADSDVTREARATGADQWTRGLWYCALPSAALERGRMVAQTFLGEPMLFARKADGSVFCIRNQCPHRGTPLHYGEFNGDTVACPYHGWRFGDDGRCTLIPSLVDQGDMNVDRIRCGAYPCVERQGLIWVFAADPEVPADAAPPEPELFSGFEDMPAKAAIRLTYNAAFDEAAFGMMDAAHIPFVHRAWWLKRKAANLRLKEKHFEPWGHGWRMMPHAIPNVTPFHRMLGGQVTTEIQLRLPGFRIELIYGDRHRILNLLAITPIDDNRTQMLQALWWTMPGMDWLSPAVALLAKRFLSQDADIINKQNEGLAFGRRQQLIADADTQMRWWLQCKKEWAAHRREGRPFTNPMSQTTLRFRS